MFIDFYIFTFRRELQIVYVAFIMRETIIEFGFSHKKLLF